MYAAEPTLFVARERELARLDEYWQRAQRGRGQMIFVTGEAGSGKTALLQAFVGRTQNAHADLIAAGGACAAQIGIGDPYLPFRDLLNLLTGALETRSPSEILTQESATRLWHLMPVALASLVEVAPDLVDHLVPSTALLARARLLAAKGTGWLERLQTRLLRLRARAEGLVLPQTRIFAQVTDLLHNLATRHPLLLVLEDLHWADTSSLSLLFHLSRMLEQRRILIIGTYRPEEVSHGWEGKPHPLQTVLSECKRQFGDIWVDLAQVSEQSGRQFVDAFLDSEPNRLDEAFRAALFQRTEGHPLFTIELLRDLQARGDLQQDGAGRWTIARNLDWATVPARVEGVIEKRIERLTPAMRQALSAASVEGEEFTAEVVAGVQSVPERELVRQLGQEVDRQHQLVSAQNLLRVGARSLSRYRFRHNLFQQYLYQSLGSAERTYLHEAIAKMLESLYGEQTEQVAAQLAHHFAAAEIIDKAVDYLFQAGEKARFLSANSEAIKHFRYGLALLATLPDTPERAERELALQVPLGSVLSAVRGYAATEVGETFNRAYTLCQQLHNNSQLFSVLHGLHHFYYNRGEWQRARAVGEEMVNLANANQDPLLYAEAHQALSIVLFHLGKFDLALRQAEQGVAAYDRTQQQAYLRLYGQDPGMVCLSYAAQALWCLGYFDQARQRIEEAIRIGEELAHPFTLTRALNFLAILNHFAGDAEGTLAATEARSALIRKYGFQHYLGGTQVMRGWALSELGRGEVNEMQQGLATMHAGGSIIGRHYFLSTIAVAYANN
ncbi:MAG TPA: AAA family ATPase, partial [Caldilineaceae bacterium]|nr:AAA family ATPase [Caldilineaceae bacterium]